ncbi:MAG: prepilin-type N-terminal cleavage/methylation domain-containing protein [bacterium]|nr:prepilin-type N-terminal cleavage/methylation domain-containing protein [bacterium]
MKKGFTLAEVLITLVIIGVIAAMTIPTLMNSTNNQEFRVGLKKAISALNQAMSLNYALEGTQVGSDTLATSANVVNNLFKKRMSVITTATSGAAFAVGDSGITATDNQNVFYTADGMRFAVSYAAGEYDPIADQMYYGLILIDVNGEKAPNTLCTNANQPTDTYVATMYGNRVVAGNVKAPTAAYSTAAQQVVFDKKSSNQTSANTNQQQTP